MIGLLYVFNWSLNQLSELEQVFYVSLNYRFKMYNIMIYKEINSLRSYFYSPLRGRRFGGSAFSNALALRKGGNSIEWMVFIKWSLV